MKPHPVRLGEDSSACENLFRYSLFDLVFEVLSVAMLSSPEVVPLEVFRSSEFNAK